MIDCLGCGCTDPAPGADCYGEKFWTWINDEQTQGLCSSCAAIPFEDLLRKMQIRAESIIHAGNEAIRRMHA